MLQDNHSQAAIAASDTHYYSRSFTRFSDHLNRFWDQVDHYKKAGVAKTEDDRYFIAYREAERTVRELCEQNQALQDELLAKTKQCESLQQALQKLKVSG